MRALKISSDFVASQESKLLRGSPGLLASWLGPPACINWRCQCRPKLALRFWGDESVRFFGNCNRQEMFEKETVQSKTCAAVCQRGTGRMPTGTATGLVGVRAAERATVVSCARPTRTLWALLGSLRLAKAFRPCGRAARNVVGTIAAGKSGGPTIIAAGPPVDRTSAVV